MSGPSRRSPGSSSYSAFADVDSQVSKPVLGSDGAASWQEFRKESSSASSSYATTANRAGSTGAGPVVPVKRADRLGTGLKDRDEERRREELVRRRAGDAPVGSGYTSFKRRLDPTELAAKKKAKLVADRVRPEDKLYYLSSETFDGWREDYVFTTRSRGTGYYWDGMDSVKKQLGKLDGAPSSAEAAAGEGGAVGAAAAGEAKGEINSTEVEPAKKKKKKKKKKVESDPTLPSAHVEEAVDDANNPMEQVAAALRRRQLALLGPPGSLLRDAEGSAAEAAALTGGVLGPRGAAAAGSAAAGAAAAGAAAAGAAAAGAAAAGAAAAGGVDADGADGRRLAAQGWERAADPTSQKTYYFNRGTGERRWAFPLETSDGGPAASAPAPAPAPAASTVSAETAESTASGGGGTAAEPLDILPDGWKTAADAASGKEYYYNFGTGKRQWEKPS